MNFNIHIETSKKKLISLLDKSFPKLTIDSLTKVSESSETIILNFIIDEVMNYYNFYTKLKPSKGNLHFVGTRGDIYKLIALPLVHNQNNLVLKINPHSKYQFKFKEKEINLLGYGKYSKVIFEYPQKLLKFIKVENISIAISELFETGYLWFKKRVSTIVNKNLNNLSKRLYSFVKKNLFKKELRQNLWFASITDGFGFRLIDESVVSKAFRTIGSNLYSFNYSTNRYVAELLCTYLPEDMLLMKKAIDLNTCIDADLKEAKYKKDGSIYAITLATLYGCDSFTVYPLFRHQKVNIVVLFDTDYKDNISTFLDIHKNELQEICESEAEHSKGFLKNLKKKTSSNFWNSIELKPNFFGLGIDLKRFFKKNQ